MLERARSVLRHDLDAPSTWPVLDSVRGATVLAVVTWHVFRLSSRGISPHAVPVAFWPLGAGRLGVDVFFVLSGYLVIRSWRTVRVRTASTGRAAYDFFRRRFLRIFPAYWASLVVLLALSARPVLQHPRHLLLFFTLNEYVRFWLPAHVNVVYWSLTVEWHFYLLVPLVAWLMTRIGSWTVLAGTLAMSLMWWSHTPPMRLPQGFVFGRLDQFVAGAIVCELVVANAGGARSAIVRVASRRWFGVVVGIALVALAAYHGSTLGASRRNGFDPFLHPVFGLFAAAGILYLLTTPKHPWLEHRTLRAVGMISFSLYLWHYPILRLGIPWAIRSAPIASVIWVPLVTVVCVALCFVVATLSYLLVERRFFVRKQSSKAAVAGV